MRYPKCVSCYGVVGWVGLFVNLTLSVLKLFVGLVSGSQALVADSMYSCKDVITSGLVIIGLKVSNQPIDKEHPYGHGKIEFILSAIVSVVFMGITGVIFFFAAESIVAGMHQPPHMIALWTAILSIFVNIVMFGYTRCVAFEINSPMVQTLSRHHGADGASSIAVALGIIGSHYLNMPWMDSTIAIFETLHLIYIGGEIFWDSFKGLMDSSAPKEVVSEVDALTIKTDGVQSIEALRTRLVGQSLWVDMTIGVDPELDISEAKKISDAVETALIENIEHLGNANIHFKSLAGSVPEMEIVMPSTKKEKVEEEVETLPEGNS